MIKSKWSKLLNRKSSYENTKNSEEAHERIFDNVMFCCYGDKLNVNYKQVKKTMEHNSKSKNQRSNFFSVTNVLVYAGVLVLSISAFVNYNVTKAEINKSKVANNGAIAYSRPMNIIDSQGADIPSDFSELDLDGIKPKEEARTGSSDDIENDGILSSGDCLSY